jgi:asparagine synthase (glutamine-hydrolysing)
LATPSDVIINHVATSLKKQVGVVLGGEGADEAFCGYTIPHWSGTDFDRSMALASSTSEHSDLARESLKRQYGRDLFFSASDHYLLTNGLIPRGSLASIFRDEIWTQADGQRAVERYYDGLFDRQPDRPMAEKYKRVLFRVNLESLLGRLDSATMSASLEARVPFTDHRVVELAFQTPHEFKIDVRPEEKKPWLSSQELASRGSLRSKRVLRSVAARWMPNEIAQRPKQSFPTPLPKWINNDWKSWSADKLKKSDFANSIFRQDSLDAVASLPSHLSMWKWPLVNIAMWGDAVFG